MAIPTLTPEQLKAARDKAAAARRARAELKEKVRTGKLSISQAIKAASKDAALSQLKVVDLLKAMPQFGEKRAGDVMDRLGISEIRRIRGLGRRQVEKLTEMFG